MLKEVADIVKLKDNKSFCPICLDIVQSSVIERNGNIYLDIYCPKHGRFENLHKWDDPAHYATMNNSETEFVNRYPTGLLIDTNFDCNQSCNFCYAQANERKEANPSLAEIIQKTNGFKGIHIMLAGGEPTLREDLSEIILELKKRKFIVTLATNGKRLLDKAYVRKLKKAGLDNIQLQFDTMDDAQCEFIRNERLTDLKKKVIDNLKDVNISVHLWVPLIKGINDDQVKNIVSFAAKNSRVIKIVFFVPMWSEGRIAEHNSITAKEILKILQNVYNLNEDAYQDYAKFDFYSSLLYQRLTNTPFIKYQTCTVAYYFYYLKNTIIPLSKIIDLKIINHFLENACKLLNSKKGLLKFYYLFLVSWPFFLREILLRKDIWPLIYSFLRVLFFHILHGSPLQIRGNNLLQIRVEALFDRHNSDFQMLKHCNLYTQFKGELMPFCEREIIRKRHVK